jgi:hypothetical protein
MMYRDSRQNVTGLVVNKKINVAREYLHNIRAMVHRLVTTGQFEILGASTKDEKVVLEKRPGTLNELHGMLGFIDSVECYNKTQTRERAVRPSSRESVYRQFLLYSTFYAPTAPVLICEGPTDNVYLTPAIRSLAGEFPALVEQVPGGKIRLKIRLYKYTRSNTARLLGLNDDGANSIRTAINDVSKVKPTRAEAFMHVVRNLYAVPTPLQDGVSSSKIEDFFDSRIKETVIEGKSFHEGNSFDTHKHYGKKVFAHKVIRPNADKVDFSGFRPLLQNIVHAIAAHGKSLRADAPVPKGSPEPK